MRVNRGVFNLSETLMNPNLSIALNLLSHSFSEGEITRLNEFPEFLEAVSRIKTLDDAEKTIEMGDRLLEPLESFGISTPSTP